MSRPAERPDRKPLIALVDRANRALQADMVRAAQREGYDMVKPSHNAVFGFLSAPEGPAHRRDAPARGHHPAVDG